MTNTQSSKVVPDAYTAAKVSRRADDTSLAPTRAVLQGEVARKLCAEFIGTLLLVLFGAGAVVAALKMGDGNLTYAGMGMVGLSFALVIAAVIYIFENTSGAHINPAVTVALAAAGRFRWSQVPGYIAAQILGGFAGALLIVTIFGTHAIDLSATGGTVVGPDYSQMQAAIAEALGTFLVVATVMALAVDQRAHAGFAGLIIGLVVACEIMVIGPISGGSVNPARTLGPYGITSIFGGAAPWGQLWVYWVGPLIGGILGALTYELIGRPSRPQAP